MTVMTIAAISKKKGVTAGIFYDTEANTKLND
jgi:hypothetical protein